MQDVSLDAEYIMVRGVNSLLQIGTEDKPFTHKAIITMHGRRDTAKEIPTYGAKNIAVRFGTLDLHGMPKTPTWTHLGVTANAGDTTVRVSFSLVLRIVCMRLMCVENNIALLRSSLFASVQVVVFRSHCLRRLRNMTDWDYVMRLCADYAERRCVWLGSW